MRLLENVVQNMVPNLVQELFTKTYRTRRQARAEQENNNNSDSIAEGARPATETGTPEPNGETTHDHEEPIESSDSIETTYETVQPPAEPEAPPPTEAELAAAQAAALAARIEREDAEDNRDNDEVSEAEDMPLDSSGEPLFGVMSKVKWPVPKWRMMRANIRVNPQWPSELVRYRGLRQFVLDAYLYVMLKNIKDKMSASASNPRALKSWNKTAITADVAALLVHFIEKVPQRYPSECKDSPQEAVKSIYEYLHKLLKMHKKTREMSGVPEGEMPRTDDVFYGAEKLPGFNFQGYSEAPYPPITSNPLIPPSHDKYYTLCDYFDKSGRFPTGKNMFRHVVQYGLDVTNAAYIFMKINELKDNFEQPDHFLETFGNKLRKIGALNEGDHIPSRVTSVGGDAQLNDLIGYTPPSTGEVLCDLPASRIPVFNGRTQVRVELMDALGSHFVKLIGDTECDPPRKRQRLINCLKHLRREPARLTIAFDAISESMSYEDFWELHDEYSDSVNV